jgi:hypothetical protein
MPSAAALANGHFHGHYHACAFVAGPTDERAVVEPLLAQVAERGDKSVYIVDPARQSTYEQRLRPLVPSADHLEITTWNEAHLKGGSFDAQRMIAVLGDMLRERAESGRSPLRLIGQMEWMLGSPPGIEQLVGYESAVNDVLSRGQTPTVCIYDVRRMSGSWVMDLMRAHPLTIVNGVLHENPFYTPPDELLRELEQRSNAN